MANSNSVTVLNRNTDFRRLYRRGSSYANPALVIYFLKNRAGICRIGITSSKRIGNAVQRNKSRRLIRAAFREVYSEYEEYLQGYDFIFVARVRTRYKKSTELAEIMLRQLKKAGIIPRESVS
ncbi:MAG: ribonuclease P protein component [Acutalibacteraceae bacterium]|jgi:ribonuclease P protein component|nr:ribonuclease P protein component [Acutalibacteraceae bacterium]